MAKACLECVMYLGVQRLVTFNGEDFDLKHLDFHSDGKWSQHVDMLKIAQAASRLEEIAHQIDGGRIRRPNRTCTI